MTQARSQDGCGSHAWRRVPENRVPHSSSLHFGDPAPSSGCGDTRAEEGRDGGRSDSPRAKAAVAGTARPAGGRACRAGSRGLPAGPRPPVLGTRLSPPAQPSRTTRPGLRPDGVPPQVSPPCARSATSNSLHCPAPPRSRPSPSSQPLTPPNRQGRAQEGVASCGSDSAGRPGCATAAPGGPESRCSRLRHSSPWRSGVALQPPAPGRPAPAPCAPEWSRAGRGAREHLHVQAARPPSLERETLPSHPGGRHPLGAKKAGA